MTDVLRSSASALRPDLALPAFSLVVPLFNERDRITESLPHLAQFVAHCAEGSELLLVDDGSDDGTPDVVQALLAEGVGGQSTRLLCEPHRGKGAAIRAGLAVAQCQYAGFCDVDLATPLDELQRLLMMATLGPALVIASRDVITTELVVPEGHTRELLGKCFNRLLQATLTPGIYDTQCGAKVGAGVIWRQILGHSEEEGFAWDVEAVAVARRLGFAVWEVGVRWSHDPRTRVRPVRDGVAMLRAIPRIWRSVRPLRSVAGSEELMSLLSGLDPGYPTWPVRRSA